MKRLWKSVSIQHDDFEKNKLIYQSYFYLIHIGGAPLNKKIVKNDYSFDQVFAPSSCQIDIFEMVSPIIQSALDGYNVIYILLFFHFTNNTHLHLNFISISFKVCIFAYGQTGKN